MKSVTHLLDEYKYLTANSLRGTVDGEQECVKREDVVVRDSVFRPMKDRTVQILADAILTGKIKPGERLNESQLARDLNVSRAPVREALQQLQEQSLIVNIPRRGMYAVSLDDDDIQKINSLRIVLEAEAIRLASDT